MLSDLELSAHVLPGLLRVQAFFTALPLGFGLLHLILYAALPRLRSNLYYGLFLVFIAATVFLDFQEQLLADGSTTLLRLHRACLTLSFVFGLRFFYEVFLDEPPRRFRFLAAVLAATGLLAVIEPRDWFWPLSVALAGCLVESCRAMLHALRHRREDTWFVAGGFLVFAAFASYDLLLDLAGLPPLGGVTNAYQFGLVGLFVATSAYLARNVARTSERLVAQERRARAEEVERRVLEAEVERTTAELEEARALQLSLLPAALPRRPGLEVAVYMRTATEVGGDYYDFAEGPDGVLTVAVGDATGHGLRAGIMVAVAKSLFQGLRADEPLRAFLHRCTRTLKPMRFGNLFMALTLARVEGSTVTLTAAGMPPALVYRGARGDVEQVTLKGMPLGAFLDFPYQEAQVDLAAGDVLLLLTDGLPETFNAERAMLGWERVRAMLREQGRLPLEDLLDHLRRAGDAWRAHDAPEDDVTLLALRRTAP